MSDQQRSDLQDRVKLFAFAQTNLDKLGEKLATARSQVEEAMKFVTEAAEDFIGTTVVKVGKAQWVVRRKSIHSELEIEKAA